MEFVRCIVLGMHAVLMLGHAIKDRWWLEFTFWFWASWLPSFLDLWVETMVNSHKNALLRGVWINNWAAGEATSSLAQKSTTIRVSGVGGGVVLLLCQSVPQEFPWGYVVGILIEARAGKRLADCVDHMQNVRKFHYICIYMYIDYVCMIM